MRRRSFLVAVVATSLLAGCGEQTRRDAPGTIDAAERFALADVAGQAVVIGIRERSVRRLFELGVAASDVTWARWSAATGGAVLALVTGNGPVEYWMVDRASRTLRRLPGTSDAGDAVALGDRIWQIGPGPWIATRRLDDRGHQERRLPMAIPTRIATSGGRVFVLGQTTDDRPIACEVSADGATTATLRIPRPGLVVDLAATGTEVCVSVVPDVARTGSDQSSELLVLDRSAAVLARRRLDSAGLLTTIGGGVAVVDSRSDGRFVVACDGRGGTLWERKLPSGAAVLSLGMLGSVATTAADIEILALQEDAISVISAAGIRRLALPGQLISQG